MKTATNNLERDHEHIIKLTEIMRRMTTSANVRIDHIEKALFLIKNFADGLHHAKEENLLFPLMTQKGFPVQGGPVGVMLMEHEQGRAFVRAMDEAIELYKGGDEASLQAVFQNMLGYAELLQNHIHKENNILFRMADSVFSAEEQQQLLTEFGEIENHYEHGKPAGFYAAIEALDHEYPGGIN